MAPSSITVRLATGWFIGISAFVAALFVSLTVSFLREPHPLPFGIVVGLMALCGTVLLVLLGRGVIPYLKASPNRVTYMRGFPGRITLRTVKLHPGDALVFWRGELLIWRHRQGRYDQIRVDSRFANPEDWKKLEKWAAAIWPQPPDYSHQRAIVE